MTQKTNVRFAGINGTQETLAGLSPSSVLGVNGISILEKEIRKVGKRNGR